MIFWVLVAVMTLFAIAFVLVPILRRGPKIKPLLVVLVAIVLPVSALLLYQKLGTPMAAAQLALEQMPPGHADNASMNMEWGQMAEKLAAKLQSNPGNAEGWALLARTYVKLNRLNDALPAFEKAVALNPKDAHLFADYADILATSQGGQFRRESQDLVNQALALDPNYPKAMLLKATIEFNAKHYQAAIDLWQQLLKEPGLDRETTKALKASVEETQHLLHPAQN